MEIRESQIEDILVSAPVLTKNILRLEDEPRFLCRQMIMPSGRLDLLYTYRTELLLLELKVVPFKKQFVDQLYAYRNNLRFLLGHKQHTLHHQSHGFPVGFVPLL